MCLFSVKYQKFYCKNDYTGEKDEYSSTSPKADKMVATPNEDYIYVRENYECRPKKK